MPEKKGGVIHVKYIFNAGRKSYHENNVCSRGHLNIDVFKKDIDNKYLSHIKTINISLNYIFVSSQEGLSFSCKRQNETLAATYNSIYLLL